MSSHISVPIPTEQFLRVVDMLRKHGSMSDPVGTVEMAIDYWLENASWKAEDLIPGIPLASTDRGYVWKQLFLPHGTIVRMKYQGQFHYAKVEGDDLVFDKKPISPSEFANEVTGTSRNAWRDLWIKRPTDQDYHLADTLRSEVAEAEAKAAEAEAKAAAAEAEAKAAEERAAAMEALVAELTAQVNANAKKRV